MKKYLTILSSVFILFSCSKNDKNDNLVPNENEYYVEYTVDNKTYSMSTFKFVNSSQDTGFVYKVDASDVNDNSLDLEIGKITVGDHQFKPVEGIDENEVDLQLSFENREWSGKTNNGAVKIVSSDSVFEATFNGTFESDSMEKTIAGKIKIKK